MHTRGKQELVELLQKVAGMEAFHAAYKVVRDARKARREARRGERALAKLLDPKREVPWMLSLVVFARNWQQAASQCQRRLDACI
jgi:hypothetical protein